MQTVEFSSHELPRNTIIYLQKKKTPIIKNTRKARHKVSFSLARFSKTSLKPNGKSQHEKYAASVYYGEIEVAGH